MLSADAASPQVGLDHRYYDGICNQHRYVGTLRRLYEYANTSTCRTVDRVRAESDAICPLLLPLTFMQHHHGRLSRHRKSPAHPHGTDTNDEHALQAVVWPGTLIYAAITVVGNKSEPPIHYARLPR